ncbi:MAG TPA: tetratricopeptide repeat protein [Vicinamibacteria bacterium]|nr:tetratricopeptide repeat protein [Vicinamibacteria bacterium]
MKTKLARKIRPVPTNGREHSHALALFERGVKALGKKDFDRARAALDELLGSDGLPRELLERARAYRAMCERGRRASRPRTFEELLNYGVVLHNRGDFAQAVKYLNQALEIEPRNDGALYCLAAAQARAGSAAAALVALRSAIARNPVSRAQARHDEDFAALRGTEEFQALVAPVLS